MSPTRTAPELLTTLAAGWNDAMRQWRDQSQAAFDPWKQAWETMVPADAGQTWGMPSDRHHGHGYRSRCGCDRDCGCGCGDDHEHRHGPGGGHEHEFGHGHEHAHEHGHGESRCGCGNPCHCCVPEADVVLHVRAGEQRVIPFLLRNPWRREREVTLAVGPWQVSNGGRLEVRSVIDSGESVTLQPCEKRVVRLVVLVRGVCDDPQDPTGGNTGGSTDDPTGGGKPTPGRTSPGKPVDAAAAAQTLGVDAESLLTATEGKRFGCDVESCTSAYTDVRFEGCARPQRVAVVVHPASCDAIVLPCDCGCCDGGSHGRSDAS